MDTKISKKTQESLGKIIKRPPLTDKLLAKPPFRFLHDIITSVINTTGFMKGLYSADEENSDNVKDKESKIAFLQKSLDLVSLVTGRQLSMKPSKVVAGHEPEKTNEFLQVLAEAINKQVDNDSYVQRVLSSRETNKSHEGVGKEKEKSRDKSSSRRSEKERSRDKAEHKDNSRSQPPDRPKDDKVEEKDRHQKGEEKERRRSSRNEEKVREKDRNNRSRNEEKEDPEREKGRGDEKSRDKRSSEREKSSRKSRKDDTKENEKPTVVEKKESDEKIEEPAPRRLQRPTSAKGSRQKREDQQASDEENGSSPAPLPPAPPLPPPQPTTHEASPKQPHAEETPSQPPKQAPLARPSSARPAPPKQRKSEVIATDPIIKLGSGHPTNVITDNGQESDEDEQFIVEDNTSLQVKSSPSKEPDVEDETEHGGLVKKILETKKELEGTHQMERSLKSDTPSMNSVAYQKQRHLVVQKIEKLQGSIQTLTKSANPLGKIMDYIQEDLDSMQKELSKWKQERLQHSRALKHEKEITERTVEPLKLQLTSLEQTISDQMDVIATVKANIIRNDKRIVSMLHSVAKV